MRLDRRGLATPAIYQHSNCVNCEYIYKYKVSLNIFELNEIDNFNLCLNVYNTTNKFIA